jgi:hypothetical protein
MHQFDRLGRPQRIQLSRRKGWRMPPNTVKVDRSTKWGNPFVPGKIDNPAGVLVRDKQHAFELYRFWASNNAKLIRMARAELRDKNTACWCPAVDDLARDACHGAVLLMLANSIRE